MFVHRAPLVVLLLVILVIQLTLLQLALSSGDIEVLFVSYNNRGGKGANGHCCDGRYRLCYTQCDHMFTVCVDTFNGDNNIRHCNYGKISTDRISDRNRISSFGNKVANKPNPMIFTFTTWRVHGIKLKIKVMDYDSLNSHDDVDMLVRRVAVSPQPNGNSGRYERLTLSRRTSLNLKIRVTCHANWYGRDCSTFCNPRQNSKAHYTCDRKTGRKVCKPDWEGANCDKRFSYCSSRQPCHNSASCVDEIHGYHCICAPGYTGKHCEVEAVECVSSPCVQGRCIDLVNAYRCECHDGFTGKNCDVDIDECESSPCSHGTCVDTTNGYNCLCPPYYSGENCEARLNRCASAPCVHGICVDSDQRLGCVCLAGYTGKHCEVDVSECSSSPCEQGRCIDLINSYRCVCHDGFTGKNCEIDVDECHSSPCLHGKCVDFKNGYICQCHPYYTGVTCDVSLCGECPLDTQCVRDDQQYRCMSNNTTTFSAAQSVTSLLENITRSPQPTYITILSTSQQQTSESLNSTNYKTDSITSEFTAKTAASSRISIESKNQFSTTPEYTDNRENVSNGSLMNLISSTASNTFIEDMKIDSQSDSTSHSNSQCLEVNPCLNNSTCLMNENGTQLCVCDSAKHTGVYCENHISVPRCSCGNLHDCSSNSISKLNCSNHFTDDVISITSNSTNISNTSSTCDDIVCFNNATCVNILNEDGLKEFFCNCSVAWIGTYCEQSSPLKENYERDACLDIECKNHGTCIELPSVQEDDSVDKAENDFFCGCLAGFTGRYCEEIVKISVDNYEEYEDYDGYDYDYDFQKEDVILSNSELENMGISTYSDQDSALLFARELTDKEISSVISKLKQIVSASSNVDAEKIYISYDMRNCLSSSNHVIDVLLFGINAGGKKLSWKILNQSMTSFTLMQTSQTGSQDFFDVPLYSGQSCKPINSIGEAQEIRSNKAAERSRSSDWRVIAGVVSLVMIVLFVICTIYWIKRRCGQRGRVVKRTYPQRFGSSDSVQPSDNDYMVATSGQTHFYFENQLYQYEEIRY